MEEKGLILDTAALAKDMVAVGQAVVDCWYNHYQALPAEPVQSHDGTCCEVGTVYQGRRYRSGCVYMISQALNSNFEICAMNEEDETNEERFFHPLPRRQQQAGQI